MKTRNRSKIFVLLLLTFLGVRSYAQDTLSVLFLGNSYTYVNDLPKLVSDLSISAGKTLFTDANTPGGYTLSAHIENPISIAKIQQGKWDYIIIQEQSQLPSIDYYRYNDMYPAFTQLRDTIAYFQPCAKIISYMTWGRRFGGQQCDNTNTYCSPVFTDFNHMQDSLTSAYLEISNRLHIQCAPVGELWKSVLNDTNIVLHSSDNSHPAIEGSYLAACAIFSSIWKMPSTGLAAAAGISGTSAQYFQTMSDQLVFNNSNKWNLRINTPEANFNDSLSGRTIKLSNHSSSLFTTTLNYQWSFGDGNFSAEENPTYTYAKDGDYRVSLIASYCNFSDTLAKSIQIKTTGIAKINKPSFSILPNPCEASIHINTAYGRPFSIHIYNATGQCMRTVWFDPNAPEIDLKDLANGLYYLQLEDKGELLWVQKLIKNNN